MILRNKRKNLTNYYHEGKDKHDTYNKNGTELKSDLHFGLLFPKLNLMIFQNKRVFQKTVLN